MAEVVTTTGEILYYGLMAVEEGEPEYNNDLIDDSRGMDSFWDGTIPAVRNV